MGQTTSPVARKQVSSRSAAVWTSAIFVCLLVAGAFFIGDSINAAIALRLAGLAALQSLLASVAGLSLTIVGTMFLLYRLDLGSGSIRRRIRAFEVGWKD